MIDTNLRLEKRHKLSIVQWSLVLKPRSERAGTDPVVLKDFGPAQFCELFGETDEPVLQLAETQFTPLQKHLASPVAWSPEEYDYELVCTTEEFELLESSAPDGELQPAIEALFTLPESAGKWCVLILNQKLGDFNKHETSPIFMFPAAQWGMAKPIIVPYIDQIQSVCYFLPKLKIFYIWAFVVDSVIDGLQGGKPLVGEIASMLTAKIAHHKPTE